MVGTLAIRSVLARVPVGALELPLTCDSWRRLRRYPRVAFEEPEPRQAAATRGADTQPISQTFLKIDQQVSEFSPIRNASPCGSALASRGRCPAALDFWRQDKAVGNLRVAPAGVIPAVRGGLITHDLAVVHRHPHAVELELELSGLSIVAGSDWPAVVLAAALFGPPDCGGRRTSHEQGRGW